MGRELMRQLLQAHLDRRQPGDAMAPVRDADGVTRAPTPVQERTLETIFGTGPWRRRGTAPAATTVLIPRAGSLILPRGRYSLEARARLATKRAKSRFIKGA